MVSKNRRTLLTSLQQKKYRYKYGLFIAEGLKVVKEFLNSSFELESLYVSEAGILDEFQVNETLVSELTLKKISALTTPNKVLGVFKIRKPSPIVNTGLIVALDGIRDPGNLGTIIRLCDWFGVEQLVCSKDTVDCYNPKVVQATMGSLIRVHVVYESIDVFLKQTKLPVFGAVMEGTPIYNTSLPKEGVLVLGNEANGISSVVDALLDHKITIPRFGKIQATESLNVSTAAAVILSEFRRSTIQR
ncbi:TrmH family RNA methyltransferase [Ascidiimonas sp. W6]|uniref:TrmH family RNA methyltransferase n=1 Tax=Ascidiimonas meishanensis TaxID=3128903 RepID=UPI0030ED211D